MISIHRTDSKNKDFIALVAKLDADLGKRDGEEHAFYHQFNDISNLHQTVVLYMNEIPVGCGALKVFDSKSMEIKRMYIETEARGKGLATLILKEVELWTFELAYKTCLLETGKRQPEAIALYTKNGYKIIPNYGQYEGIENSVCFQKNVSF